jgi:hypothetical protein
MKTSWVAMATITVYLTVFFFLTGCQFSAVDTSPPTATPGNQGNFPVSSPQSARDAALNFLEENYEFLSFAGFDWAESEIASQETTTNKTFLYSSKDWVVAVSFPNALTENSVVNVIVINDRLGFEWQGLIDVYGEVWTTTIDLGQTQPTATQSATPPTTDTPTPVPPTNTPLPTATPLPTSTPTSTPTPVFTPTPTPLPCNAAAFITDVTIPDGSLFAPNADFVKTWRLQNVGTCTWTTGYDLVYVDGYRMDGPVSVALPENVSPGENIDLSVRLSAPQSAGDYQGFWMLRDANSVLFGIGDNADSSFWVNITVIETSGNYEYDFSIQHCAATWWSETARLRCDDTANPEDGFVRLVTEPELENRNENEPALWVHPNETRYGWVEGTYPAYTVRYGDVFKAWVGCMAGYDRCNVTFYLSYEADDGRIYTLEEWIETYDGEVTVIDLNLSDLAGETVRFILGMEVNTRNVEDAQGFWFVPRIEHHAGGGG